jgi:hypothetical protein
MQTFQTAIQLAKWIKSKNYSPLQEEMLMRRGIDNKKIYGEYCLKDSDISSLTTSKDFKLNGDIANDFNDMQEEDFWDGDDSWCE